MIDGQSLASTAKHTPEQLDADIVRQAGHILMDFEELLSGIHKIEFVDDSCIFTITVDKSLAQTILYYAYGE